VLRPSSPVRAWIVALVAVIAAGAIHAAALAGPPLQDFPPPAGTFTAVSADTATTSDGRTVTGARTYHTCSARRPGGHGHV
jgi:hypothetical protein